MIRMVRNLREMTGGFGVLLGLAHDWANREGKMRSWDLFARYVMPEFAT
jgi:limonene 1,2-monooxygenase